MGYVRWGLWKILRKSGGKENLGGGTFLKGLEHECSVNQETSKKGLQDIGIQEGAYLKENWVDKEFEKMENLTQAENETFFGL